MTKKILVSPHIILNTVTEEVVKFDNKLVKLVDDMFETMYEAGGCGLAAPQIGISSRVFVYDYGEGQKGVMVNPSLKVISFDALHIDEGCLSIPGERFTPLRYAEVECVGYDQFGKLHRVLGTNLLSRCFQHEVDHLKGVLVAQKVSGSRQSTQ